jgi:hypothetical protein
MSWRRQLARLEVDPLAAPAGDPDSKWTGTRHATHDGSRSASALSLANGPPSAEVDRLALRSAGRRSVRFLVDGARADTAAQ